MYSRTGIMAASASKAVLSIIRLHFSPDHSLRQASFKSDPDKPSVLLTTLSRLNDGSTGISRSIYTNQDCVSLDSMDCRKSANSPASICSCAALRPVSGSRNVWAFAAGKQHRCQLVDLRAKCQVSCQCCVRLLRFTHSLHQAPVSERRFRS